jgi:hypothetical protein
MPLTASKSESNDAIAIGPTSRAVAAALIKAELGARFDNGVA